MKPVVKFIIILFIVLTVDSFSQDNLKVGDKAPDVKMQDAFGNEYSLSSYIGESPVVLYFYPKAGTSGCTKQACAIRDDLDKFKKNNIQVFGVSTDTKEEIEKFVEDYNLNFPLLSDSNKKVSEKFGVLKENGSAKRVTFIINKEGEIAEIIEVNDIDSHSDYVFNAASKLSSSDTEN